MLFGRAAERQAAGRSHNLALVGGFPRIEGRDSLPLGTTERGMTMSRPALPVHTRCRKSRSAPRTHSPNACGLRASQAGLWAPARSTSVKSLGNEGHCGPQHAVFRLPHRALPRESSAQQGITSNSSDFLVRTSIRRHRLCPRQAHRWPLLSSYQMMQSQLSAIFAALAGAIPSG